ncbi:fructosamine-3-kinase [Cordyceps fumosorosea ARSEF 2679]|uniref:protein-ribulosamine 3-kinase n=1 Tax=Cordyceps fumosorosea (strain ARSEF 2679) TaxID=1081104 RepID=A0A167M7X6_CORFA|nr:fructosamine-3-kinase [Cordyceps fumosorosea ARSEF 2679]OAA54044.1 fructosamine-3-kinase [Cordyceps fumosorosea ARSEF 2679]
MARKVDSVILETLGLDASETRMSPHGGSGFASTFKLSTSVDGQPCRYFIKTGRAAAAETMFRGEHASLNAIADAVPGFCPRAHAHGAMRDASGQYFLATDFLDLSSSTSSSSRPSLAAKLAQLHTTPAPTPGGAFGFPVITCCGATPQDNTWTTSWPEFFAERRLRAVLRACKADAELSAAVETVAAEVVPRLLGRVEPVAPVVLHGDLWSGNHGRAAGGEEVAFDPAAVYGHAEYDLGIMRMFGGFGRAFWEEYHALVPKAEPREEWEDRIALYELYHHLNHLAMFGGGYRGGAMAIMKGLIEKYAG